MTKESRNTRHSLLKRAIDLDDDYAWKELFSHYKSFIYKILQEYNIRGTDADDIVQEVMVTLTKNLKTYNKEKGLFRTWFSRVIRNHALMRLRALRAHKEEMNRPSSELVDLSNLYESPELESKVEQEWKSYIVETALERVSERFNEKTMRIFKDALDGVPAQKNAEENGVTVNSIYIFRNRVKNAVTEEIRSLTKDLDHSDESQ